MVLDATSVDDATMSATAAEVGYSESAFVVPGDDGTPAVRYFSPLAEAPFCGHATIAPAVAHADRHGTGPLPLPLPLRTSVGTVPVTTAMAADGTTVATLVSVAPRTEPLAGPDLAELPAALRWSVAALDPALPPRTAYAGARHPVIAAADRGRPTSTTTCPRWPPSWPATTGPPSTWSGGSHRRSSTPATPSRRAESSRTRPPARRRPPSAATCGNSNSSTHPRP
ncbi:phenazine biosynthesis protein PhzF family [Streptomyces sp. yr375]|nr:phenazine biosynthesis protein PhzF family [Streptomyces sp. yr375]